MTYDVIYFASLARKVHGKVLQQFERRNQIHVADVVVHDEGLHLLLVAAHQILLVARTKSTKFLATMGSVSHLNLIKYGIVSEKFIHRQLDTDTPLSVLLLNLLRKGMASGHRWH